MEMSPETLDSVLQVLTWLLVGFGAVWLVSSVIAHFHRRAYNLTHAESGRSKNIKPDFLKVDQAKRQAATERGRAYDAKLTAREAEPPQTTAEKVSFFSRLSAGMTAVATLVTTVLATLSRIPVTDREVGLFGRFFEIVNEHKWGALVALLVISANVFVFVETSKKWRKTPVQAK
jgi:hypothetical protein